MNDTNKITLEDLMAEDIDVWVKKSKSFGFDLHMESSEGNISYEMEGVHPYAMASFADFCRRFLHFYDSAKARCEVL
jgi:hypothetical protein